MNIFNSNAYETKQAYWQSLFGLACLILMCFGYLASRAVLSIASVALFVNAFWPANWSTVVARFRSSSFGIWAALYFLVCVTSYFWSEDKGEWSREVMIQFPFLLLPLGFCSVPLERVEFRRYLYLAASVFSILAVIGSLVVFYSNYEEYTANYKLSMPMPSTRTGDHIRFSLWLALLVLMGGYQLIFDRFFKETKWAKIIVWVSIVLFTIYMHILSAKTGLLMLYIVLFALGYYLLAKRVGKFFAGVLPLLVGGIALVSFYFLIPTFTTKVDYVADEIRQVVQGKKLNYNLSDHGRIISVEVGIQEIQKTGFLGTGAGDVLDVMKEGYNENYAEVPMNLRFMPFNQFILNFLAYGFLLGLPIVFMSLTPFFNKQKKAQFFVNLVAGIMLLTMLFEGTLELQTGVFVYLFMTMWTLSFKWEELAAIKKIPN